jgi:CheY-like chemotaxis protein
VAREKILFVDDEASIRELAQRFLTLTGYPVTTAASEEEALQAFKRDEYALVVTERLQGVQDERCR